MSKIEKTVLITGASRGIGAASARRFAKEGYAVGLHYYRSEDKAVALAEELRAAGAEVLLLCADIREETEVHAMVAEMLAQYGRIDVLLCNAGEGHFGLFSDLDYATFRQVFSVNVDGMYHCIQAALPQFIARKDGVILTMASMWGLVGASCEVAYSASKGAVIALTKALAKELGPSGIRVNCIAPGLIDTEMNAHLAPDAIAAIQEETPLGCVGQGADVAETALFLASPASAFYTGQVFSPNGGFVI